MRLRLPVLAAIAIAASLVACKRESPTPPPAAAAPPVATPAPPPPPEPFRVSAVEVGNAIGPDKRVVAPASSFAPQDTIYASVATEGASVSTLLSARWTYEDGQVVSEESQTIAPTGPATSEFHIAKPDGWPAGKYKVEITADGAAAGSQEFEVKAAP